jgi:uncharacterized protein (TIGR02246 family)
VPVNELRIAAGEGTQMADRVATALALSHRLVNRPNRCTGAQISRPATAYRSTLRDYNGVISIEADSMPAHAPAELHELFRTAFNRGDLDALAALYEPAATLIVDGAAVQGIENIRATLQGWLSRKTQMALSTRSVIESTDGLAVLHGVWTVRSTEQGSPQAQGVSTEVVRQQPDGTWLFVIDSPYTPGGPTPTSRPGLARLPDPGQ